MERGFSLVELLIVIGVIGIIAAIIIPDLNQSRDRAADASVIQHMNQLKLEAAQYYAKNGTYGTSCIASELSEGVFETTSGNLCDDFFGTSYSGVSTNTTPLYPTCTGTGSHPIAEAIQNIIGKKPECISRGNDYRVLSPILKGSNAAWCIDSSGFSGPLFLDEMIGTGESLEDLLSCGDLSLDISTGSGGSSGTGGGLDTNPPSSPADIVATPISGTQIDLSWTPSTDDIGVVGYDIVRNGTEFFTTTTPSFSDTGLTPSTTYSYTITAHDAADNISSPGFVVATTLGGSASYDVNIATLGPPAPIFTNLLGSSGARIVSLRADTGNFLNDEPEAINLILDLELDNIRFPGGTIGNKFRPLDDPNDDATLTRFVDLLEKIVAVQGSIEVVYLANPFGTHVQVAGHEYCPITSTDAATQSLYAMNKISDIPGVTIRQIELGNELHLNGYRECWEDDANNAVAAIELFRQDLVSGKGGYYGYPTAQFGIAVPPKYAGSTNAYYNQWEADLIPLINSGAIDVEAINPHYHHQTSYCYNTGSLSTQASCILAHYASHPVGGLPWREHFDTYFNQYFTTTYPGKELWFSEWSPKDPADWPANTMYSGLNAFGQILLLADGNRRYGNPYTQSLYHQLYASFPNAVIFDKQSGPTFEPHSNFQKSTTYYALSFLNDFLPGALMYASIQTDVDPSAVMIEVFQNGPHTYVAFANWTDQEYTTNAIGEATYITGPELWSSNGTGAAAGASSLATLVQGETTNIIKPYAFGYIKVLGPLSYAKTPEASCEFLCTIGKLMEPFNALATPLLGVREAHLLDAVLP